ncbi:adenosylcobinamide-GDP ribazoletransferase [Aquimonas sp.]|jgi:adenosylcobinamide-GDP ribazoletransferase|uniref:adenosylcobinamide-GDP ribazoletransferase n=1 Tax=Aquimonas sp. TaxID=1872588 RepID=UPI0037BE63F0
MNGLWFALAFLTRLPTPALDFSDSAAQARALAWYPLVGLLIGALLLALATLLQWLHAPAPLAAACVLALWVWLSGGLHLDGLADCADAWAGGHGQRERILQILKDPAAGPMGVVAIVLVLLLKFAALQALLTQGPLLLLAPVLGRVAAVALFLSLPYVRAGGLGAHLTQAPRGACLAAAWLSAVSCLFFGWPGVAALAAAIGVFMHWRSDCHQRLGGFTGDAAGAAIERVEAAAVVAAALALALVQHG